MGTTKRRTDIDLERVRAAIEQAERRTSAEIVVSLAPFFIGRVWPAARRAFARLGIANTRARNGVLLFVVPARRRVVVLADEAAVAQLPPSVWRDAADRIARACARGRGTEGIVEAVDAISRALAGPFPYVPEDINELPDRPTTSIS